MKYLEWIKESKTYICPKSGIYKVICVGGGSSGGGKYRSLISHNGNATSFGNLISADGGRCFNRGYGEKQYNKGIVGGQCGYDGINYGSAPFISWAQGSNNNILIGADSAKSFDNNTGHGYGAGGGSKYASILYYESSSTTSYTEADFQATPGGCGKMESTIVDLTEGQSITCTVGKGGSNIFTESELRNLLKPSAPDEVTFMHKVEQLLTTLSDAIGSGADGVIIIQYLGESM